MPGVQPPFPERGGGRRHHARRRATPRPLQAIEQAAGRERPFPGAARTLDLDLILFGSIVINEPRADACRTRGFASGDSCSSRWPRLRPSCAIRSADERWPSSSSVSGSEIAEIRPASFKTERAYMVVPFAVGDPLLTTREQARKSVTAEPGRDLAGVRNMPQRLF